MYKELEHILSDSRSGHVIVIDDARLFGTDPAYPTIEELTNFIHLKNADFKIVIQDDSIRLLPQNQPSTML